MSLEKMGQAAREAAYQLATVSTAQKNRALAAIADELEARSAQILAANEKDIAAGREAGLTEAMLDRLLLNPARLAGIVADVRKVITLDDPVGAEIDSRVLENGLRLSRRRVPIGVIGVIYEARPNVTIDIASLCLKTGNASILRGGRETFHSNLELVRVIQHALAASGLPEAAVQYIDNPDRALVAELLRLDRYVDMIIPAAARVFTRCARRTAPSPSSSAGSVSAISSWTRAPIWRVPWRSSRTPRCSALRLQRPRYPAGTREGGGHLAAATGGSDERAQGDPGGRAQCHGAAGWQRQPVRRGAGRFRHRVAGADPGVKVVADVNEALAHMREHNAGHSDAILTNSLANAERFVNGAGSAAVYVNASTRFTDGGQFGLGAEVAVSTQMLHARGPMGLTELTSYKWVGQADYLSRA